MTFWYYHVPNDHTRKPDSASFLFFSHILRDTAFKISHTMDEMTILNFKNTHKVLISQVIDLLMIEALNHKETKTNHLTGFILFWLTGLLSLVSHWIRPSGPQLALFLSSPSQLAVWVISATLCSGNEIKHVWLVRSPVSVSSLCLLSFLSKCHSGFGTS